jgi:hypothetical protein
VSNRISQKQQLNSKFLATHTFVSSLFFLSCLFINVELHSYRQLIFSLQVVVLLASVYVSGGG